MARVQLSDAVIKTAGGGLVPAVGASVQVNARGGGAVTVYAAATGGTTVANPVIVDANGRLSGWVEQASLDLVVSGSGITTYTAPVEAVSATSQTLGDGTVTAPAVTFASDPNTGVYRLSEDRLGFTTNGTAAAYFNNDGALILVDASTPLNLGSGTARGTLVLGFNRALRALNAAGTGTIRLLNANSSDEITIGSGGTEGGPPTSIILRNTQTELFGKVVVHDDYATPAALFTVDPTGPKLTAAGAMRLEFTESTNGQTVLSSKQSADTVNRMAFLENGREEYSSGSAAVDVIVIPRNNANEWRLAKGYMLLDDTSTGGFIELAERTDPAVAAANRARLFARDNGSGKTQLCVRFPSGAAIVLATEV